MVFYLEGDIPNPFSPKTTEIVDRLGAPTLVVEIASTSLNDDLGRKRLLYERLGIKEYWIVDVLGGVMLAFGMESWEPRDSGVSGVAGVSDGDDRSGAMPQLYGR